MGDENSRELFDTTVAETMETGGSGDISFRRRWTSGFLGDGC